MAHEDRPYAGWDDPVVDSESVMLGYKKTKATDLKYQERIEALKNKGRLTWVYIILGLAAAFAIGAFAYMNWLQPALANRAKAAAETAPQVGGFVLAFFKYKVLNSKRYCNKYGKEK